MKRVDIGACVLTALVAAGCGGSSEPASEASSQASGAQGAAAVDRTNPCSLLTPSDVAEVLGLPSEMREIYDEVTCRYHFTPASAPSDAAPDQETFIEVKVHWTDGKTAVMATRMAGQLLGGGGESGFERIPDLGDEAWMAPFASYLSFSKGDVGVEIDMRMLPGEREKTIRLAQLMASRL